MCFEWLEEQRYASAVHLPFNESYTIIYGTFLSCKCMLVITHSLLLNVYAHMQGCRWQTHVGLHKKKEQLSGKHLQHTHCEQLAWHRKSLFVCVCLRMAGNAWPRTWMHVIVYCEPPQGRVWDALTSSNIFPKRRLCFETCIVETLVVFLSSKAGSMLHIKFQYVPYSSQLCSVSESL